MKSVTLILAGLLISGTTMAQSTWNFGSGTGSCDPTGTPGEVRNCGGSGTSTTVNAVGWSNTGSGGAFVKASLRDDDPYGLGLVSGNRETTTNSHHAFDNRTTACGSNGSYNTQCGGSIELMTLNFTSKVNLTSVTIAGFLDTDVAIYRWDGAGSGPTMTSTVATLGSSSLAGWTLVKSEDVGGSNNNGNGAFFSSSANTDSAVSSWWLISTYFGSGMDSTADAFKITSVTGNVCQYSSTTSNGDACTQGNPSTGVPEPASLMLGMLALAALWLSRQGSGNRRSAPLGMMAAA